MSPEYFETTESVVVGKEREVDDDEDDGNNDGDGYVNFSCLRNHNFSSNNLSRPRIVNGIVFRRLVRAGFATFDIAVPKLNFDTVDEKAKKCDENFSGIIGEDKNSNVEEENEKEGGDSFFTNKDDCISKGEVHGTPLMSPISLDVTTMKHVIIIIHFHDSCVINNNPNKNTSVRHRHRSAIKREFKIGDLVELSDGPWMVKNDDDDDVTTNSNHHEKESGRFQRDGRSGGGLEEEICRKACIATWKRNGMENRNRSPFLSAKYILTASFLDDDKYDEGIEGEESVRGVATLSASGSGSGGKTILKGLKVIKHSFWEAKSCQEARSLFYPNVDAAIVGADGSTNADKDVDAYAIGGCCGGVSDLSKVLSSSRLSGNNYLDARGVDYMTAATSFRFDRQNRAHGGSGRIGKRQRGEIVANFLFEIFATAADGVAASSVSTQKDTLEADTSESSAKRNIIQKLSSGTGVVDVAGGCGHVSLALSLLGVKSTVVDPRPSAGRLPRRDRRALRRAAVAATEAELRCAASTTISRKGYGGSKVDGEGDNGVDPPLALEPVPFSTLRAWFISRPDGIDVHFREGTAVAISRTHTETMAAVAASSFVPPICSMSSPDKVLPTCSAIVALHPDEATDYIVDFAVQYRKPFVIVPCCVFSRLFPNRKKANKKSSCDDDDVVGTYEELIDYLMSKHSSIQKTELSFDGANLALWSLFRSS